MPKRVLATVSTGGIIHTRYVNGRTLTAADLHTDQVAESQHHKLAGRAGGEGVVEGLEVQVISDGTGASAIQLSVSPGYGYTAKGDLVRLAEVAELTLAEAQAAVKPQGGFVPAPAAKAAGLPLNVHASVLAAAPVQVQVAGAGWVPGELDTQRVEAVQFRQIPVTLPAPPSGFTITAGNLQNLIAHLCFGTPDRLAATPNPFGAPSSFGILTSLKQEGLLTDQEVPLALICSTDSALLFVDIWTVRRRRMAPGALMPGPVQRWQDLAVAAEAVSMQFQAQVSSAMQAGDQSATVAGQCFCYLPAAGYLPGGAGGYQASAFFTGFQVVSAAQPPRESDLLAEALTGLPIDLSNPPVLEIATLPGSAGYLFRRNPANATGT